MTTPPGLEFLAANGTPDPQAPTPGRPESQLPSRSPMPGGSEVPADSHKKPENMGAPVPRGSEILGNLNPENMGDFNPEVLGPNSLAFLNLPKNAGSQKRRNYPDLDIYDLEVHQAISILAKHNIQTVMPGGMAPTPNQEQDPEFHELPLVQQTFLRVLEKTGRVSYAADTAGVARGTVYRLKKSSEKFARLWERAMSYRGELFEDEAIRRAVKGVREDIYYMGAICGSKQVYSDALLSKLLEGNMPAKYRQNHKVEVGGTVGLATLVLPATLSAEEWTAQNSGNIIDQEPEDVYA